MISHLLIIITCQWINWTFASNILVLSPITLPSHSIFVKSIVSEMAKRGHTLTYWNGLKPGPIGMDNVRQLYSETLGLVNSDHHHIGFNDRKRPLWHFVRVYGLRTVTYCKAIYEDPIFHQLMTTDEQFDLILMEGVYNECALPLVDAIKAPFIYLNGFAPMPWHLDAIGSPQGYDYFPNPSFSFTDKMNLWQRTFNTIGGAFLLHFRNWFVMPMVDRIASMMLQNYSNLSSVAIVEDQYLSLIISNTHSAINYEMPKSPALIQAGGLHCTPSKPLPKV